MSNIVFLMGTARSGTSYLGYKFATHPQIRYFGEFLFPSFFEHGFYSFQRELIAASDAYLLPEGRQKTFDEYFAKLNAAHPDKKIVLDLKIEQFALEPIARGPVCRAAWKFLLLTRINYLKQTISEAIMFKRIEAGDQVVHRDYVPDKVAVNIEPNVVLERMRLRHRLVEEHHNFARASGRPCLDLCYEEISSKDAELWDDKILEFCEIDRRPLTSKIVKQNIAPLADLVENYDDVVKAVRRSEFAYTLHMPE